MTGRRWTESDYERLFGLFPADGARPSKEQVAAFAREVGRTNDAISWQWEDGAAYVSGRSASTTSLALKRWLDRRGRAK
jgi:hypothetical protein